ncbi:MAG: hypothetical protein WKF75_01520 [Singulisphaera sp.]
MLDAVVRNISQADLAIWDVPYDGDGDGDVTEIHIAYEEGPFARFRFNLGECMTGRHGVLRKGETWNHPVSVLYSRARPPGLAFREPGNYTVKVVHPLILFTLHTRKMIESNPVRIRIDRPTGEDARVWPRIATHEVLEFLQFEDVPHADRAVNELVRALRSHPTSRYRSIYKAALDKFTRRGGEYYLSPDDREGLREVLGTPKSKLFPDDRRLDVNVRGAPSSIRLANLFDFYFGKSQVPFTFSPELGGHTWDPTHFAVVLRDEMEQMSRSFHASWAKRGDGYHLSPDAPTSGKKAEEPK